MMNRARLQRDLGWGAAAIVLLAVTTARSGETDLFERDLSERHRLFDRHLRFDADSRHSATRPAPGRRAARDGPQTPTAAAQRRAADLCRHRAVRSAELLTAQPPLLGYGWVE